MVHSVEPKRRLPVIQSTQGTGGGPAQEPSQVPQSLGAWVAFGVVAIFVTWVPLAAAAEAVRQSFLRRWVNPGASASEIADAVAALPESFRYRWWGLTLFLALVPLGLSCFGAGYLVGRWAPKDVAKKAGALAGFAAATMALGAAWVTGGAFAGALVPWGLVMAFVWAGTRVGYRRPRP